MKKRLLGITVLCLISIACFDPCDNQIKQELTSPDGKYRATAFIRNCGATTGFSPQVYLRPVEKEMKETGNIFVADHSDQISIRWVSASELEISSAGQIVTSQQEFEGIKITVK
ncbi:MAG: hypothetical protein JST85_29720 [Acidobacteria bacterium]|nr:hypothetical protein [Acidobacteriota bacterium]